MSEIPESAQRSPDGHYWWDEQNQAWQPVQPVQPVAGGDASSAAGAAASAAGDAGAGQQGTERTGTIEVAPGDVLHQAYSHDEVVAMVENGGAALPLHEGEALA